MVDAVRQPSKKAVHAVLWTALWALLGFAVGCGGSGSKGPVTVSITPGGTLNAGQSISLAATVSDGSTVTWSEHGGGHFVSELDPMGNPINNAITYVAPVNIASYTNTVVTATSTGGSSAYAAFVIAPLNSFPNLQPVSVNGGPVEGQIYPNGAFTSVTVCVPGTVTCNTIDGILVDTASVGLRILASALPALPAVTDSQGNNISECAQFVDQSFVWGNVELADVKIAGEQAASLAVQSIADPSGFSIPSACTVGGSGGNKDNQRALGANGILGVGLEPQDCGSACTGAKPASPAYYSCAGSCTPASVPLAQQLTNPIYLFSTDNNGMSLQLPALYGVGGSLNGTMIFGIGTQSNNSLINVTVFTVDKHDNFTTSLAGQSLTASFLDSGSNGLFFPSAAIPACAAPNSAFFCPSSQLNLSAVNLGTNQSQSTINFSVENADALFTDNPTAVAFSSLAGSNGSDACSGGAGACSFDWGLPFFYGRTVTAAINGQTVSSVGMVATPPTPWWAYSTGFPSQ